MIPNDKQISSKTKDVEIDIDLEHCEDIKIINEMNEFELFINIYMLDEYILRHENDDDLIKEELAKKQYLLKYMISKTANFGVHLEEEIKDNNNITSSYNSWYKFNLNSLKALVTNKKWEDLNSEIKNWFSISNFIPLEEIDELLAKTYQKKI